MSERAEIRAEEMRAGMTRENEEAKAKLLKELHADAEALAHKKAQAEAAHSEASQVYLRRLPGYPWRTAVHQLPAPLRLTSSLFPNRSGCREPIRRWRWRGSTRYIRTHCAN